MTLLEELQDLRDSNEILRHANKRILEELAQIKTKNIRYALENYRLYLEDLEESTAWQNQIQIDLKELKEAYLELDTIEEMTK